MEVSYYDWGMCGGEELIVTQFPYWSVRFTGCWNRRL